MQRFNGMTKMIVAIAMASLLGACAGQDTEARAERDMAEQEITEQELERREQAAQQRARELAQQEMAEREMADDEFGQEELGQEELGQEEFGQPEFDEDEFATEDLTEDELGTDLTDDEFAQREMDEPGMAEEPGMADEELGQPGQIEEPELGQREMPEGEMMPPAEVPEGELTDQERAQQRLETTGAVPPTGQAEQMPHAELMADWSQPSKKAFKDMVDKYGQPDSVTDEMAIWNDNGPWARTIVYGEAVDHHFPMPHKDVLEQFVYYEVPTDKYDEIAEYDGSVILERTKGEISARCDMEGANFLAINLAKEIADGKITVEEARQKYGEEIRAMKQGNPTKYTQRLLFDPMSQQAAADPGEPLPGMAAQR